MAEPLPRITKPTIRVLKVLLEDATGEHYGLDVGRTAGLKSGSLYPILSRLEDREWVTSRWEDLDPSIAGRPRRRFYQLTGEGITMARSAVVSHQRSRTGVLIPGNAP